MDNSQQIAALQQEAAAVYNMIQSTVAQMNQTAGAIKQQGVTYDDTQKALADQTVKANAAKQTLDKANAAFDAVKAAVAKGTLSASSTQYIQAEAAANAAFTGYIAESTAEIVINNLLTNQKNQYNSLIDLATCYRYQYDTLVQNYNDINSQIAALQSTH